MSSGEGTDAAPGLTRADALARFHVRAPDGSFQTGGRAFAALWSVMPRFRRLGSAARLAPVAWLLDLAYAGFLRLRPYLHSLLGTANPR